jgi:hypothetical protein
MAQTVAKLLLGQLGAFPAPFISKVLFVTPPQKD